MTLVVPITSSTVDFGETKKGILLFTATWHDGCAPIEAVLTALASTSDQIFVGTVDAEAIPTLTDKYNVTAVPTVIFCHGDVVVERLEGGVEPAQVTVAFQRLLTATTPTERSSVQEPVTAPTVDPEQALKERLDKLIRSDTVMLFLKGTPSAPRCGFSRQAVELLNEHKVPFGSFDILTDEDVRQGLKKHSNWPTYPQIYVNGELQGGLDVLKELAEEGSLLDQWGLQEITSSSSPMTSSQDRLRQLVNRSHVMVFMKGLPSAPRCGFSRQLIELLDGTGIPYDAFDILQDDDVRQGLKTFSNWPTYPQLYVKGELIGGLDICKELQESGELIDVLKQ